MSVAGKHIVLTGASSGIGESAALRLAELGARLCLVARREPELLRVRDAVLEAGGEADIYPADLSDQEAVGALAQRLLDEQPRIDVLINNAGRSIRRPVAESLDRFHDYTRTMQLNYFAPVQLTLALLPRFYAQGAGHIINVSSMAALIPTPRFSAYTGSKCALDGFSRTLAAEHVGRGIAVTTINYPLVKTPMTAPTRIYRYLPQMDRRKAAEWMVEAIARRPVRMTTYTGRTWGTATAALPGPTVRATGRIFRTVGEALRRRAERDSQA
ncbi:SDR family NAD(P)-dependent oxidoreductase [Algiphilus aromaticivorans]|uniref:SDR family NAD(P)-dependent oxidoreductase n=1 Tax=Algiphilus aromaticivorans TaxID=382454 RepID=UPI0005C258E0|nr:SDR family NAD(P)-dependent oxidoreductase [Algiphilus aromaticivorans]